MISKTVAYLLLLYLMSKALIPPNPSNKSMPLRKFVAFHILPYIFVIFWSLFTSFYLYIMYQQEHENVAIINARFSEWTFFDIVFYTTSIMGCCFRLWCFRTLKNFFTYNVTILEK